MACPAAPDPAQFAAGLNAADLDASLASDALVMKRLGTNK